METSKEILAIREGLKDEPTDEERVIGCFPPDSQPLARFMVRMYIDLKKEMGSIRERLEVREEQELEKFKDFFEVTKSKKISALTVKNFLNGREHLIEGFGYREEDGDVVWEGENIKKGCRGLMLISNEIEEYYGNVEVNFSEILKGLKKYFFLLEEAINLDKTLLAEKCEEYLSNSKTKKRKRVPWSCIKETFPDLTLEEVRPLMKALRYIEEKNSSGVIFFKPSAQAMANQWGLT